MAENLGAPKRIRTSGLCLRRAMFLVKSGIKPCVLAIQSQKHGKNKGIISPSFTALTPQAHQARRIANNDPTRVKGSDMTQSSAITLLCRSELPERAVNKGLRLPDCTAPAPHSTLKGI